MKKKFNVGDIVYAYSGRGIRRGIVKKILDGGLLMFRSDNAKTSETIHKKFLKTKQNMEIDA